MKHQQGDAKKVGHFLEGVQKAKLFFDDKRTKELQRALTLHNLLWSKLQKDTSAQNELSHGNFLMLQCTLGVFIIKLYT